MNMREEESSFSTSFDALLTKELSVELVTSKNERGDVDVGYPIGMLPT
jgi:hypothetical protein